MGGGAAQIAFKDGKVYINCGVAISPPAAWTTRAAGSSTPEPDIIPDIIVA